jgi:aerobic-type carbon monoxide dehydrogenase small subunit (CoxS/CutS family)
MAVFSLRINGRLHQVDGDPADSLLSILRYELGLSGSKFGCGEGHCGACTVLVDDVPTRACIARLSAVTGKTITTIEGLGTPDTLHPVQKAFLDAEAFQCGYCTPGMVMAAAALLKTTPRPSEADIVRAMNGNVCRCGTFPRIVKAIHLAADEIAQPRGGRDE